MILFLIVYFVPLWIFVYIFRILYEIIHTICYIFKDLFTLKLLHLLGDILFIILIPFDMIFGLFQTFCQTIFALNKVAKKEFTTKEASKYLLIMQENPRDFKNI